MSLAVLRNFVPLFHFMMLTQYSEPKYPSFASISLSQTFFSTQNVKRQLLFKNRPLSQPSTPYYL